VIRRIQRAFLCILLCSVLPVLADSPDLLATLQTLRYSEGDRILMRSTLIDALNQDRDGMSRHWKNADTGRRGRIKIVRTLRNVQPACRLTRVTNYDSRPGTKTSVVVTFCRQSDGSWALAQ